ncbi:hypothetical protein AB0E08_19515 [Streptomyces sp. NPDC048281]|uniref:hypothetical protein n=1 Tax=Streptomyces sp. NPDC048281 TaxID=3154715 RepID=UPI00341E5CD8
MPMFKALLAPARTVPEEEAESPVQLANGAKRGDVDWLNDVLVPLVFHQDRAWFEQEDSWVAECLAEWADPDTEGLFHSSLREDAGQSELEMFVDAFGGVVEQWRVQNEQAQPQPNPDFDPAEPVEGTQFYKYAKLPGTQEFQWLYASGPDSADWQILDVRYDQYDRYDQNDQNAADAGYEQAEIVEPYGDHFMKAVDGRWVFGTSRDAAVWHDEYEQLLAQEGLLPEPEPAQPEPAYSAPAQPAPAEAVVEEPAPHAQKVAVLAAVADGLDARVFDPEAELTAEEAEEILSSQAGEMFFGAVTQLMADAQKAQLEELLKAHEDLSAEELSELLELVLSHQA